MNSFSAVCFILLSSDASFVFGSNTRGGWLDSDHGEKPTGNLALSSEEVAREETTDDTAIAIFKEIKDGANNLLARSYTQLSNEINDALLEVNTDMDDEEMAYARQAFMDFLKEDNDALDAPVDAVLSSEESDKEEEREAKIIVEHDSLVEAMLDSDSDGSIMQLNRGWGRTSYRKNSNKGCRNYHGERGSNYHDYDLYEYVSKSDCKMKCNRLGDHCYGYEYYSYDKRCEIWKVPIDEVQYVHGLDCYTKNGGGERPIQATEGRGKYLHADNMDRYPGYTGSIDIYGHITVTFLQQEQMQFSYDLQGLEPGCTDCGVHIHSGTTCDDAAEVGRHYFSTEVEDPWTTDGGATYNADKYGTARGSFSLSSGLDTLHANRHHAVVVHGQDGTRLSCGILEVL